MVLNGMSKLNLIAIIAIVASISLFAGMVTAPIFAQGNSSGNNASSNGISAPNGNSSIANNNTNMTDKIPNNMTR
jgi:hypothetical protein